MKPGEFPTCESEADEVSFEDQQSDESLARQPDGGSTWVQTADPTPGESNGG